MTEIDISKIIDKRNELLWNEISSSYQVKLEVSTNSEYSCYSESNLATFYIPLNSYSVDSFSHEMLHIYIRLKEIFIGANLNLRIGESRILKRIFNKNLLDHIGNCLDHIKMFPIYIEMGFEKEKFLLDFQEKKCTENEISRLKKSYKIGRGFNIEIVALYIGKFFAIKADPNPDFNYEECLKVLKKIDSELFACLIKFVKEWEDFEIEINDPMNSYRDLVSKFYDNLKTWMSNKEFK